MRPLVGITLLYKRHIVTVKTALSTDWLSCFPQFSGSAGPSSLSWVWRRSSSVDLLSSVPAHWPTTSSIKWAGLYSCLAVRLNIELEASSQTDPQKLSSEGDYHENILKYVVRFLTPKRRNCIIYSICNDGFGHSPFIQCPSVSEIGELWSMIPYSLEIITAGTLLPSFPRHMSFLTQSEGNMGLWLELNQWPFSSPVNLQTTTQWSQCSGFDFYDWPGVLQQT